MAISNVSKKSPNVEKCYIQSDLYSPLVADKNEQEGRKQKDTKKKKKKEKIKTI